MCATCGCGKKDKSAPGYGKGKAAVAKATKNAPAMKKKALPRKKGM